MFKNIILLYSNCANTLHSSKIQYCRKLMCQYIIKPQQVMGPELRINLIHDNKLQFSRIIVLIMANNAPVGNCLKDMVHIVKFDGTNHFDWKYEFLGILEQHGFKHLIEPTAGGDVVARPNVVKFFFSAIFPYAFIHLPVRQICLKCIVTC